MKVGVDIDQTLLGFPEVFKHLIPALIRDGHEVYCTTGHPIDRWPRKRKQLKRAGIEPGWLDTSLMKTAEELRAVQGVTYKAHMADQLDVVFDDHADRLQEHTATPIFKVPGRKAQDA